MEQPDSINRPTAGATEHCQGRKDPNRIESQMYHCRLFMQ